MITIRSHEEVCAACVYWSGARGINERSNCIQVETNAKGTCTNANSYKKHSEVPPLYNGCGAFLMHPALG